MSEQVTEGNIRKKAMIEALEKSLGIVAEACREVGISRKTHYQWLKEDEEYSEMVEEISESALDFAESKLFERINGVLIAGNGKTDQEREENCYRVPPSDTALIFYLKTKGKSRGYIERQEFAGVKDQPIIWQEQKTYETKFPKTNGLQTKSGIV